MPTKQDIILKQVFLKKDWMDINEIMEETNLTSPQVHRAVIHLQRRGLIKKERRGLYVYFRPATYTAMIVKALQRGFGEDYQEEQNADES